MMTPDEIQQRFNSIESWVSHITASVTELHDLVAAIARAGEEADKRISELAAAQIRTEDALRRFIERGTSTNGH